MPGHAQDGVVALGPARRRVDEGVDGLVQDRRGRGLVEHDLDVGGLEDLLVRVEGQAGQLALDQVGAVLHDGFQLDVPVRALPARDQVEHVHARRRPPLLDAPPAGQLHADGREQREARGFVPHPEQAGVEVDLRGQGRDGDQAGVADEQEGRDRLVEEARLDVRGLLQHDEVPPGPLGRRDLPEDTVRRAKKSLSRARAEIRLLRAI